MKKRKRKPTRYVLVFAYGSNMHQAQMLQRGPGARACQPAGLVGWRLAFTGYSERRAGSVATIEPRDDRYVVGRLWEVPERQMPDLDQCEGVDQFIYRRETMNVLVGLGTGAAKVVEAQVYIHNDERPMPLAMPGPTYVATIRTALRELQLDESRLNAALARTRKRVARNKNARRS